MVKPSRQMPQLDRKDDRLEWLQASLLIKPDRSMNPEQTLPLKPLSEAPFPQDPSASDVAAPDADWQTSVQKIYDRKTQERRPHYEGDPQRYRQVAAELAARTLADRALDDRALYDDGLIDDSTTIAAPHYAPLVLPSPRGRYPHWREITGTTFLEHEIIKGDARTQQVDVVFAKVAWEVLRQFGIESAYALLLLTTRLVKAKDPWEEIVELNTQDLLSRNIWERDSDMGRGKRLRQAGNWLELLCNLSLLVNQIDPVKARFTALRIPFWVLEEMEYSGTVTNAIGGQQPEEAQDLLIRVGLGLWSEQFIAVSDRDKQTSLVQLGHQASLVLSIDPHRKPLTAKLAILLMLLTRLATETTSTYAIGALLEAIESKAVLMELRRRKDRLYAAYVRWNTSLQRLQKLGWTIEFDDALYPPNFQPTWHNPTNPQTHLSQDSDQWLDRWLQCQIRVSAPQFVAVVPDPRDLPLPERFTGRNLAQALEIKGLSQSKLADHLQLDRSMVTYWIKGARLIQPKHRHQICALLGPELEQVLT
jgi:hypothetical protein